VEHVLGGDSGGEDVGLHQGRAATDLGEQVTAEQRRGGFLEDQAGLPAVRHVRRVAPGDALAAEVEHFATQGARVGFVDIAEEAANALIARLTEAGHPPPLTLTEAEWRSSVDVFAIEHADILQRHKILYSAPPFDLKYGVTVSPRDLRLQLEYEALGMLLRLRGRVLTSDHDGAQRLETLVSGTSQVLVLFRAILRLRDEVPPADNEELCRKTAAIAEFDASPFIAVLGHWRGGKTLDASALDPVLETYHKGLEQVVAYLDALPAGA